MLDAWWAMNHHASIKHQASSVKHQAPIIGHRAASVQYKHQASSTKHQASSIKNQASSIKQPITKSLPSDLPSASENQPHVQYMILYLSICIYTPRSVSLRCVECLRYCVWLHLLRRMCWTWLCRPDGSHWVLPRPCANFAEASCLMVLSGLGVLGIPLLDNKKILCFWLLVSSFWFLGFRFLAFLVSKFLRLTKFQFHVFR